MPIVGVTGIEISPQLHLHFVPKSMLGCFCCCAKDDPRNHDQDTQYYIDSSMKARRWADKRGCSDIATTHARLKLITIRALLPFTTHPFEEAEQAFKYAEMSWNNPTAVYRADLDRLDASIERVKHEILNRPL